MSPYLMFDSKLKNDMGKKLGRGGCANFFWGSWVPIEHKVA